MFESADLKLQWAKKHIADFQAIHNLRTALDHATHRSSLFRREFADVETASLQSLINFLGQLLPLMLKLFDSLRCVESWKISQEFIREFSFSEH